MWSKILNTRLLVVMAVAVTLVVAIACAAEEAEAPVAPAAAATAVPAAAAAPVAPVAPAAPAAAPAAAAPAAAAAAAAPVAPAPAATAVSAAAAPTPTKRTEPLPRAEAEAVGAAVPATCYILGEEVTDCPLRSPHTWQAPTIPPGEYPSFYTLAGATPPKPTKFYESPMSYQLVKAGQLPPVEERLPEDFDVMVPVDEIGEYGGVYRQTGTQLYLGEWIAANWYDRDSNGVDWYPQVGKSVEISEDGRVYTLELRKGLKWSDGTPFTMEDIRFAWEDCNYNEDMNPLVPPSYRDPVTGEPVKFAVVDDLTWTMTFDTPVFNIFELRSGRGAWCGPNSFCFFVPPYMKQFHPKYADATELQKLIDDGEFDNWVQLFGDKTNQMANTEKPCVTAWCLSDVGDSYIINSRNHYYYMVDPEGNQLPYTDATTKLAMESRETAVFRAMNGENDGMTTPYNLQETPLYMANMEKGDYSIYHWPSTSGSDANISINQTYNEDPEIGRWLRTRDFRIALSLGMDRESINDALFLGVGTPQNMVPHPSTPYYPGPEWATLDVVYDLDRANSILDDLGLTERTSDGYRMRLDGAGPLTLHFDTGDCSHQIPGCDIVELLIGQWGKLGIKVTYMPSAFWGVDAQNDRAYLTIWETAYVANPWSVPNQVIAVAPGYNQGAIGLWFQTKGEQGMGPTGPDPAYLPLAPEGTYPADPTGHIKELQELWQEGRGYPMYSPERIAIGKRIMEINALEKWNLCTLGFTGVFRGVFLNRNNARNQPKTHIRDHNGFLSMTYYFEEGRDNINHSDNRSKLYTSWSFLSGER